MTCNRQDTHILANYQDRTIRMFQLVERGGGGRVFSRDELAKALVEPKVGRVLGGQSVCGGGLGGQNVCGGAGGAECVWGGLGEQNVCVGGWGSRMCGGGGLGGQNVCGGGWGSRMCVGWPHLAGWQGRQQCPCRVCGSPTDGGCSNGGLAWACYRGQGWARRGGGG